MQTASATGDERLLAAQVAFLGRVAPGTTTRRIRWSGGETQVLELGAGPPVLLVHGGMGEAFQWGPLLPALAAGHRVLAVDRPGHGLADPFDHTGVDMFALGSRFIGECMDALEVPRAALVGASMGGLWSIAFALAHPERTERLVLVGSPAGVIAAQPMMLRVGTLPLLRTLVRRAMLRPTTASVRGFWKALLVAHPERLPEDFLQLSALSQARNAPSWFSLIDRAMDIRGMRRDLLLAPRWSQLAVPTTIVWGEKDAWTGPAAGQAVAAAHPRVRVVTIADAGHVPWFDAPEAVTRALLDALAGG